MNSYISNENIKDLLDRFILDSNNKKEFKLEEYNASDLIHKNRFDLGFKLFYLNYRLKCPKVAIEIYKDHIRAFSFGKFHEKENPSKKNISDFINSFEEIYNNIKQNGFDEKKSLVPVSNNLILNGSHRLAVTIFLNKKIKGVKIKNQILDYDYKFFLKRNVKVNLIEKSLKIISLYCPDLRIAIIWPSYFNSKKNIKHYFNHIFYEKNVHLSDIGKHNFVTELYKNEKWLGSFDNDFVGAKNKMYECFKSKKPLKIIVFKKEKKLNVDSLKSSIRDEIGIGKHSIHISDDNNFLNILEIIFNENSLSLLNSIKYSKLKKQFNLTNIFRDILSKNQINLDDVLITGSFPLSLFQIRKNNDLDIITLKNNSLDNNTNLDISNHNKYLDLYKINKDELIYDETNYFYFNGFKVLNLKNIIKFKKNRAEKKDKIDLELITKFNKKRNLWINSKLFRIKFFYYYEFFRYRIILFLIKIKIYNLVKKILK